MKRLLLAVHQHVIDQCYQIRRKFKCSLSSDKKEKKKEKVEEIKKGRKKERKSKRKKVQKEQGEEKSMS